MPPALAGRGREASRKLLGEVPSTGDSVDDDTTSEWGLKSLSLSERGEGHQRVEAIDRVRAAGMELTLDGRPRHGRPKQGGAWEMTLRQSPRGWHGLAVTRPIQGTIRV